MWLEKKNKQNNQARQDSRRNRKRRVREKKRKENVKDTEVKIENEVQWQLHLKALHLKAFRIYQHDFSSPKLF